MQKRLADSEWVILNALWGKPAQTMKQIVEIIQTEQPDISWSYKTYHTYLRNMTAKGLVNAHERNLKDKIYSAAITKDDALRAEGRELLSRQDYFGSVGRLVATMAQSGQLSKKDMEELKALADKLGEDGEQ